MLITLCAIQIYSQEFTQSQIDSLYIRFIQLTSPELLSPTDRPAELTLADRKCGFGIINTVRSNIGQFNSDQQTILNKILSRPVLQKSMISPSGFFRIHYDTTGFNVPSYVLGWSIDQNVAEVAIALDSAYSFEIGFLGFLSPPSDGVAGGDDKYDVYIANQSGGLYGATEWELKVGLNSWTSFMVIDNDFPASQYYTSGLNAMRVTVAHEFHHGIQVGNYSIESSISPFRDSDLFFYELTSTSMEEFVFDDVNDYYGYMDSYFRRTYTAMPNQNGYNMAIWNLYLQKNFGFEIFIRQWQLIPGTEAILAINQSLVEKNTSFPKELNMFGIWNYFTNYRKISGKYFEEAVNYPLVTPTFIIDFPSPPPGDMGATPTSNTFIQFNISSNSDTLVALITNGDAFAASDDPSQLFPFDYMLYADSISGSRKLTSNYSSNFTVSNPNWWSVSEILNGLVVRADTNIVPIVNVEESFVFPNPFRYTILIDGTPSTINIALDMQSGTNVDFNVYSSGMELVCSVTKIIKPLINNSLGINWNGLDADNKKLTTGVYIYVLKNGDRIIIGKVVIFNE